MPIPDEVLKQWVGFEGPPITSEVTATDIKKYAIAVDDLNPLYVDPEAAKDGPYGALIGPPMFYTPIFQGLIPQGELTEDGVLPVMRPPVGLNRATAGPAEWEFFAPVRAGDTVTHRRRVLEMEERFAGDERRVYVRTEVTYVNQKGELLARRINTTILR